MRFASIVVLAASFLALPCHADEAAGTAVLPPPAPAAATPPAADAAEQASLPPSSTSGAAATAAAPQEGEKIMGGRSAGWGEYPGIVEMSGMASVSEYVIRRVTESDEWVGLGAARCCSVRRRSLWVG